MGRRTLVSMRAPHDSGPDPGSISSRDQTMLLIVTTMAGFLSTFMASSVNIALPMIESEFRISAVTIGWIPLAYILTLGAMLMPAGQLADLRGRKRVFLWGMIVFAVFTAAAGLASSAGWLIGLRLAQGIGAGLVFSTTTAIITSAFPPERRGRALGLAIAGVYLGLTLGPALGGILISGLGWRGLFWITAGLALLNVLLTVTQARGVEWRMPEGIKFDTTGAVVYAVALPAFLVGLSFLPGLTGVVLVLAGLAGLALFIWWETRARSPIFPVDLLRRNKVFAYSNLASLINYSATFALTFLMSLYLQYVRGLDELTTGLVLVAGLFLQAAFSPVAGRLSDRVPANRVATGGMAACVVGLLGLVFLGEDTSYAYIIPLLCTLGVGFAFFAPAITHTVMGSVEKRDVSMASATLAAMRTTGQSISQGLATLVLALVVGRHVIEPADYPQVLTSVRITFAIFTVLCVLGLAASLAARPRGAAG